MYIRYATAAVAVDNLTPTHTISFPREPLSKVFWALNSYPCREGRAVAIRLRGSEILVGVRDESSLVWRPLLTVLTYRQAAEWFSRAGF